MTPPQVCPTLDHVRRQDQLLLDAANVHRSKVTEFICRDIQFSCTNQSQASEREAMTDRCWQRERFRKFWARLSKPQRRRRGRPSTATELRRLIEQMATANPLWRAPRIHGELKMLGVA